MNFKWIQLVYTNVHVLAFSRTYTSSLFSLFIAHHLIVFFFLVRSPRSLVPVSILLHSQSEATATLALFFLWMGRKEEHEGGQTQHFFLPIWHVSRSHAASRKANVPEPFWSVFPVQPWPHFPKENEETSSARQIAAAHCLDWFSCCDVQLFRCCFVYLYCILEWLMPRGGRGFKPSCKTGPIKIFSLAI